MAHVFIKWGKFKHRYKERRIPCEHTQTQRKYRWTHMNTETEFGITLLQPKKLRQKMAWNFPYSCWRVRSMPTFSFQMSSVQNCETIEFCWFKPPHLWYLLWQTKKINTTTKKSELPLLRQGWVLFHFSSLWIIWLYLFNTFKLGSLFFF